VKGGSSIAYAQDIRVRSEPQYSAGAAALRPWARRPQLKRDSLDDIIMQTSRERPVIGPPRTEPANMCVKRRNSR